MYCDCLQLLFMEKTVELSFPSRSNKNIFGAEQSIPGIVDQTIPGCPRKERDKKMKRRLKMFFSWPYYSTLIFGLQGVFY